MLLQEIFEKVKVENARSKAKYGSWYNYSTPEQNLAIFDELIEWNDANEKGDIHGEHGEIAEAIQVVNLMCRRIMVLTGEPDA